MSEYQTQLATITNLVADFFRDEEKTIIWFFTPNLLLGGMSPINMIRGGQFKKLLNYIQTSLNENEREDNVE